MEMSLSRSQLSRHGAEAPLISLCMIVKNEARLIRECLRSAQVVAQQLIVVDTGSSDETPTLAEAEGAEVYHHPWRDSFSEARNVSLSYAKGEWVLILDGDELLDPETAHLIKELDLSEQGPEAYHFEVRNFTTDRAVIEESGLISQVRLFRNRPVHRYGGLVHNQLHNVETLSVLSGPAVPVQILHYGYTPAVWAAQNKDARISLHERSVREDPESHFVRYNYANHLKILGDHREALHQFMRAIPPREVTGVVTEVNDTYHMSAELEWALNACFLGAFCANKVEEYEVALALTEEALNRSPSLLDAHVRRAEALIALKRYHEASDLLQRGLSLDHPHVVKGRALYYDAPYRMGRALFLQQRRAEAAAPFASLIPRCQDVTVFTHLCLCSVTLGSPSLGRFARARGALLAPDDPDWPVVDAELARIISREGVQLVWPSLVIRVDASRRASHDEPLDGDSEEARWSAQLSQGLAELLPSLSRQPLCSSLSPGEHVTYLELRVFSEHARLSLYQGQEMLYTFPERYATLDRAEPIESAALLLAQLMALTLP